MRWRTYERLLLTAKNSELGKSVHADVHSNQGKTPENRSAQQCLQRTANQQPSDPH